MKPDTLTSPYIIGLGACISLGLCAYGCAKSIHRIYYPTGKERARIEAYAADHPNAPTVTVKPGMTNGVCH